MKIRGRERSSGRALAAVGRAHIEAELVFDGIGLFAAEPTPIGDARRRKAQSDHNDEIPHARKKYSGPRKMELTFKGSHCFQLARCASPGRRPLDTGPGIRAMLTSLRASRNAGGVRRSETE